MGLQVDSLRSFLSRRASLISYVSASAIAVIGILYSIHLGPDLRYVDEGDYFKLATSLADVNLYSYTGKRATAFRPPGYPFLLSLGLRLDAGIVALRALNFLLLGGSVLLLGRLARQVGGALAASLATLGVLGYPVLAYAAGTLYPQTLATTLLLAALVCVVGTRGVPSARRSLASGLLFGALILTVPTFLLSWALVLAWLVWRWRRPALRSAAVLAVAAVFVVGAWSLRNYRLFDSFVFVSTNSGVNLLVGNNELATPASGVNVDLSRYEKVGQQMQELPEDLYYREEAVAWILDNKARALRLYLGKVLHYFAYRERLATRGETRWTRDAVMLASYGSLLLALLGRLALHRRFALKPEERLLLAIYLGSAFFMAIFFTRIRFRLPLDPLLIALVALFLARLLAEGLRGRSTSEAAGAAPVDAGGESARGVLSLADAPLA